MKLKLVLIIFILGISFNIINALDYTITFKGQGATNVIDTIKVLNISQHTTLTFSGNSMLHLVSGVTEIKQVTEYNLNEIRFYPNPMDDYCIMEFDLPEGGNTLIQLFDVSGRLLTENKTILNEGIQTFRISGILNGVYFTRVSAGNSTILGKLVSTGGNINQPHISYEKTIPANAVTFTLKSATNEVEMNYNDGDTLQFTFVSGKLTTTVTDIPAESKTLIANFAETVDLQNGLVAWYPFNGNANDESGNGHHGVVNGATLTSDRFGTSDQAYAFNGQSNTISINGFNLPSSSTTIACWAKAINANGLREIISKHNDETNVEILIRAIDYRYQIEWTIGDNYFTLSDENGQFLIDPNNPRFDFLLLSYDGHVARFYINNILISSHSISGQIVNNDFLMVFGNYAGNYPGYLDYFYGTIDDIRIYNRALNNSEIQALYHEGGYPLPLPILSTSNITNITQSSATSGGNILTDNGSSITATGICWNTSPNPDTSDFKTFNGSDTGTYISNLTGLLPNTTYYVKAYAVNSEGVGYGNEVSFSTLSNVNLGEGLVAYYPFNGNANDESGNEHHAVVNGATLTTDRFGNTQCAYYFNSSSTLKIINRPDMNLKKADCFSMVWWFRTNVTQNGLAEMDSNGVVGNYVDQLKGLNEFLKGSKINDNKWHIAVAIVKWDSNTVRLCIDGLSDTISIKVPCINLIRTSNISLKTIAGYFLKKYFIGKMDDIRIYNRELNNDEILSLYHEGDFPGTLPVLVTRKIYPSQTRAGSGGEIKSFGGTEIEAKGVCWSDHPNPDTSDYKNFDYNNKYDFSSELTNLTPNTIYYVRAYAINSAGIGYGNELSFTTLPEIIYDSITDIEGNVYKTVEIGNQTWMAENLRSTKYRDGNAIPNVTGSSTWTDFIIGAYCWYNNDLSYKNSYGALYNYSTVSTGMLCPTGWHVPSHNDWNEIEGYLGGMGIAGGKLKDTSNEFWAPLNTGATNETGFSGLPGGQRDENGTFFGLGNHCTMWVADPAAEKYVCNRTLLVGNSDLNGGCFSTQQGFSVRCIKDKYIETPNIITVPISNRSQYSVNTGIIIVYDGSTPIKKRGVCWDINPNPDTSKSKICDKSALNSFQINIFNLTPNTTYYVKAYAENNLGIGYGNELSFQTLPEIIYGNIDTIVKDIEGNNYKTVKIGSQIWMAENLRTTKLNDGTIIPFALGYSDIVSTYSSAYYWFNNDSSNRLLYGALYNHYPIETKKICPYGWHIPIDEEWKTLKKYLGDSAVGGKLKEAGFEHWPYPNKGANNSSGFTALPGNWLSDHGGFSENNWGAWWSATTMSYWYVSAESDDLFTYRENRWGGMSVRCLCDTSNKINQLPKLRTDTIILINSFSAVSGGFIYSEEGSPIRIKGICWSTLPNPDTSNFKTLDGGGVGNFISDMTGLSSNTRYYVRAYAINNAGVGFGNELSFTTFPEIVYDSITDIEGNVYKIVQIGNQKWMAENLKTTKYRDGTDIPLITNTDQWHNRTIPAYCWINNNEAEYKSPYGALYNWYTVNTNILCPFGWHVPNNADWNALAEILGGRSIAGGKLKESGVTHWSTPNLGATNESGFSALPGCLVDPGMSAFHSIGNWVIWWNSTSFNDARAYYNTLQYDRTDLAEEYQPKEWGFSVRCVQHLNSVPSLTTNFVTSVTDTSSICGGSRCADYDSSIIACGVCWSTSTNPTINDNRTMDDIGTYNFTSQITGLFPNTKYYVRAYAINNIGIGYGIEYSFKTMTGTTKDIEGNIYKTVTIGSQIWMAENLRVTKYNNNTPINKIIDNNDWENSTIGSYGWFDNNGLYKIPYGALYNWYSVDSEMLCPSGWHVPTVNDWNVLADKLGGSSIAAIKMLESGGNHWQGNSIGTNESGFTAIPSGYPVTGLMNKDVTAMYWSKDEDENSSAWTRSLSPTSTELFRTSFNKSTGFSVRCVKD